MIRTEIMNALKVPNSNSDDTGSGRSGDTFQRYLLSTENLNVFCFANDLMISDYDKLNLAAYSAPESKRIYRNFLNWLFDSFSEDEAKFRRSLVARLKLKEGDRVLITGCGFGDDIPHIQQKIGIEGEVHAQDLSKEMVVDAARNYSCENALFTISNGLDLPYQSRYFDAVFHFGGINLFGDMGRAIFEMNRVCKVGGTVVFGDEGVASHLRETEYGKIAINNIGIWASEAPLSYLPVTCTNISLTYVLGNCFYVLSFSPGEELPAMNIDVEHMGLRGGTARTRFFGKVEGVTPEAHEKIYRLARSRGISVHRLLSELIESLPSEI